MFNATPLTYADWSALAVFFIAWLAYEPLLRRVGRAGSINTDMTVIRRAWMSGMVSRENRLMDGQLVGHVLNSNSFFASSNLILIAAAAGALFNGQKAFETATSVGVIQTANSGLFEIQIALVIVTLSRGLLAFIWSIRQLNYCLAAVGATPTSDDEAASQAYGQALADLLNPALSAFNSGVRSYYFAMAAAAWVFGPWAFLFATVGAVTLLYRRQKLSPTAAAISKLRHMLENNDQQTENAL